MKFSLGQAAKEVAKSKATIHRYVQTGRLSAERQDDGSYQIEASELFRVFPHAGVLLEPPQNPPHETIRNPTEPNTEHPGNQGATSALTTEIDLLRERLADKDKRLADKDDVIGKRLVVASGSFLRVPAGMKHWSGGDPKEGALFYEESSGKFDSIPAK